MPPLLIHYFRFIALFHIATLIIADFRHAIISSEITADVAEDDYVSWPLFISLDALRRCCCHTLPPL